MKRSHPVEGNKTVFMCRDYALVSNERFEVSIVADLQAEDADERPFSVVLDRSPGTRFSSEFFTHHALVAALTDAVPLLPSQVQGFL